MGVRKVVVDANHTVVLARAALISGDQFAGSIPIVWSVRSRQQIKKRSCQGIHRNGDASARSSVAAGRRVGSGGQQSLMRQGIRHRGNCRGCLYFAKPLIIGKKEGAITPQRPSDSGAELIADERWDPTVAEIEVVLSVE